MAKTLTSLFTSNKTGAEAQLQAVLDKLTDLQKDIPAAYEKTVEELSGDIQKYRSGAEAFLGQIREDVARRARKISEIEAQKADVIFRIEDANTRFGDALAADDKTGQDKILKELQDLNSKKATFDGLISSLSAASYSIGPDKRKQLQALKEQAAGIADKLDRVNGLYNAIKDALAPLNWNDFSSALRQNSIFAYGINSCIENNPEVHSARFMPVTIDASGLAFFEKPSTLGEVMQRLSSDQEKLAASFGRPAEHFAG